MYEQFCGQGVSQAAYLMTTQQSKETVTSRMQPIKPSLKLKGTKMQKIESEGVLLRSQE